MTASLFILNITDMRKNNMSKKLFNLTHLGIKIVTIILFVIYLIIYVSKDDHRIFLSLVAPAVFLAVFLFYDILLVHFHKKGFYTTKQATEFYEKCRERNISDFKEENFEKAEDIYFSVFGTDIYLGEGTLLTHMADIYSVGKKITKK